MTDESNHDAFNPKVILDTDDNGFHLGIGRMQLNPVPFGNVFLDGGFVVHQGHNSLSILGSRLLANDDNIPWMDAFVAHGVAFDLQSEVLTTAQHTGRDIHQLKLRDRLDGVSSGHQAGQWEPWWACQLSKGHRDHSGNGAAPVFIADNGPPRAPEFFRQPLLAEP